MNEPKLSSERLAYTVEDASAATSIPVSTLWLYIKKGTLTTNKVGRRRLMPADALKKLVSGEAA
jgi:excisionase family DNA binding protein